MIAFEAGTATASNVIYLKTLPAKSCLGLFLSIFVAD